MKRLICLDLDGTLTRHRSKLEIDNKQLLDELAEKYKLLMVGAGTVERIYAQMNEYLIDSIGNYGMQESQVIDGKFTVIRQDVVAVDKKFFIEKIEYLRKKYGYENYVGDSVEFHPTGMVTFPLLGTKANIEDKISFDVTREKRRVLYPEVKEIFKEYTVYIGGSSSFDFSLKQYNKYDAIMKYAEEHGYDREEILYVGDDFEDGGGDSHVRIGGLDYINIDDYRTVREKLAFLLAD